jgi:hypothetical protein
MNLFDIGGTGVWDIIFQALFIPLVYLTYRFIEYVFLEDSD